MAKTTPLNTDSDTFPAFRLAPTPGRQSSTRQQTPERPSLATNASSVNVSEESLGGPSRPPSSGEAPEPGDSTAAYAKGIEGETATLCDAAMPRAGKTSNPHPALRRRACPARLPSGVW